MNHWLSPLSLWSNEYDYVIAHNLEEAKLIVAKTILGLDSVIAYEDYEKETYGEDEMPKWYRCDDDQIFPYGHDDGTIETKTVREHIQKYGLGYFANSEY